MFLFVLNRAAVVNGTPEVFVGVNGFLVVALRSVQIAQLLECDPYFVHQLSVLGLGLKNFGISNRGRQKFFAGHQDVGLHLGNLARSHPRGIDGRIFSGLCRLGVTNGYLLRAA